MLQHQLVHYNGLLVSLTSILIHCPGGSWQGLKLLHWDQWLGKFMQSGHGGTSQHSIRWRARVISTDTRHCHSLAAVTCQ